MSFAIPFMDTSSAMSSSLTYLFNATVALFVMVDPFASIPLYLVLMERFSPKKIAYTRKKSVFVATGLLLMFAIAGAWVLRFFGISISALRIAGGILLLKISLEHLIGGHSDKMNHDEEDESLQRDDISVVPLAMPMLAGPGAISTVIVQSTRDGGGPFSLLLLLIAVIVVMWVSYLCLKSSQHLYRVLGRTGLNLLGRIMGILVAAIAVEFIVTGIRDAFSL